MEDAAGALDAARDAYRRHDWAGARDGFGAARAAGELAAADLDALADAAWWLGDVDQSSAVLEEAYRRHLDDGRPGPAAMAAIGIGVNHLLRGDGVVGSGWVGRAQRLLRDQPEHTEHGYLLYLELEGALGGGDPDAVVATAGRVRDIGRRHADPNLVAGGDLFEGRALVRQGRMAEGMALLDEAMLAVLSGELDPGWAGNIYCHLMAAFPSWPTSAGRPSGPRRPAAGSPACPRPCCSPASAGSTAPRSWSARATGPRPSGRPPWSAGTWPTCTSPAPPRATTSSATSAGSAATWAGPRTAYRHAHELGRDPQPGLALLRLAQGRAATASASIRAALTAVTADRLARAWLCAAQVEIALADGDAETAGRACDELPGPPPPTAAPAWRRRRCRPGGRCCWPAGGPRRPCRPCGRPAGAGRSWTPPTTPPGSGCCSPGPTRRWATPTPPGGSWTRPRWCSAPGRDPDAGRVAARRGRAAPARRPHRARGRGAGAGRRRPLQPGDRRVAGAQPQDGRPAPVEHLRQARGVARGPRRPPTPSSTAWPPRAWVGRPTGRPRLRTLPDARPVPPAVRCGDTSRRAGGRR